jgi:hypothetical protein
MLRQLWAAVARSAGERLLTVIVPYVVPSLGAALVLGRHWLARLWEMLVAAL